MGLLIETLRTAAPPASWIDRWFKLMDADPWGLWNEPAVLEAAGPEAQARYAERACQDWHKWRQRPRKTTSRRSSSFLTSDDDLERDLLRRRYLEVLARQDDPRALLDAMIESVETAAEYCDVVAFCEARNWHREALQWAQSAARLHPRDARCEDALLRCYERDGWDEEALAIRRQRLEHHPGPMQYMALLRAAKTRNEIPLSIGPSCSHGRNNANRRNTSMRWNNIGILNSRTRSRHHGSMSPFACNGSWRKRNWMTPGP